MTAILLQYITIIRIIRSVTVHVFFHIRVPFIVNICRGGKDGGNIVLFALKLNKNELLQ